ncbi:MAG: carboxynorspermidine decarboxylase [Candidatus Omnitrophica bacterium]|nr:carboxynorspermidine decarboxylase [Candidatus Omnitrophota bacterium]
MDITKIPYTPCYIIDTGRLRSNLKVLKRVQDRTGCSILLALKGFAAFSTFSLVRQYLSGIAASSLHEARLGSEEFGGEVHVCAPAYREDEFDDILSYADHIVFNSFTQWEKFKPSVSRSGKNIKCGLRINPEHSEVKVPLYDPCAPGSRLGITHDKIAGKHLEGITGLHFHTLCELNSDSLERTLRSVERNFGALLFNMEWVNFGGGHHITREDYDRELLCSLIRDFRQKYDVDVYLEPGEAIALNTGILVASVLDMVDNNGKTAVLDTSAAAHMPDVLEMPYRPEIEGAGLPGETQYTYRLGGMTCLAGDVIGEYSFHEPLAPGDRVVFKDMAHYTMVKNNTFNGICLPSIALYDPDTDKMEVVRKFSYEDYRGRLS